MSGTNVDVPKTDPPTEPVKPPEPAKPDAPKGEERTILGDPEEGKTTGEGAVGDDGKPKESQAAVPETYDIKLPEGVALDQALLDKATPVLKELGMTNDQANKLAALVADVRKYDSDALQTTANDVAKEWKDAAFKDPEIGNGDPATFAKNAEIARTVLKQFGPDLGELLTHTPLGNHPGLIKLALFAAAQMADDKVRAPGGIPGSGGPAPEKKSPAEVLFPDLPSGQ